jgi:hypothetical protein
MFDRPKIDEPNQTQPNFFFRIRNLDFGCNETVTLATPLYNRIGLESRIIWSHYNFPEIKSSEIMKQYTVELTPENYIQ